MTGFTRRTATFMRGLLTAGVVLLAAGSAQAQGASAATAHDQGQKVVTKFTPQMVGEALTKYGLKFESQRDRSGDPLLIVRPGALVHEQGMAVIFYGCSDDACDTFSFYTFYKTSEPLNNEVYHIWNDIFRVRTWTKAFKDTDGDTGLVLNVNAVGGVGLPSLEFLLGVFLTEMNVFREALQGGDREGVSADAENARSWASAFDRTIGKLAPGTESDVTIADKPAPKALMKGE